MSLGCQRMYAILNGIPCWCKEDNGHSGACTWPDVTGYANKRTQVNSATWPGNSNFRIIPGMPPVLEPKRS